MDDLFCSNIRTVFRCDAEFQIKMVIWSEAFLTIINISAQVDFFSSMFIILINCFVDVSKGFDEDNEVVFFTFLNGE